MDKLIRMALAGAASLALSSLSVAAPVQLISNGNFDAGLTGWTVTNEVGGGGDWFLDTVGTTTALSGSATGSANGSGNYAVTDQTGGGSHVLSQAFVVAAGSSSVTVAFSMFANDWSDVGAINNGTLSALAGPNQYARVDIMKATAGAFSLVASDILQTLLAPMVDAGADPHGFTNYSFDITSLVAGGGSYVLRFAEVDNQFYFNLGVDNVSVLAETGTVPEPATLGLAGLALAGLFATRRSRRLVL